MVCTKEAKIPEETAMGQSLQGMQRAMVRRAVRY